MGKYATGSVLDYGCGKGALAEAIPGIIGYDPAVEKFSALPSPADLVVCRDVMEHVEDECIESVLEHIRMLTIKAAYFVVPCRPTTEHLPDGRNTHISIHAPDWWREKLDRRFVRVDDSFVKKDLITLCE